MSGSPFSKFRTCDFGNQDLAQELNLKTTHNPKQANTCSK